MNKIIPLFAVLASFVLSACAIDNDTPRPTPEKTGTVVVPPAPTRPSEPSSPSISVHRPIIEIGALKPRPKLQLKRKDTIGKLWGGVNVAGNTDGFFVTWSHGERLPTRARTLKLTGMPLAATAFLPRSDAGALPSVGLPDGGFLTQTFYWEGDAVHVGETQIAKDGGFVSSRRVLAHQQYSIMKLIDGVTFGAVASNSWDSSGTYGTIDFSRIAPKASKLQYRVSGKGYDGFGVTQFALSEGVPAFGVFRGHIDDRTKVVVAIGTSVEHMVETALVDRPRSELERKTYSSQSWVRGMVGTDDGYFVLWQDASVMLTFVKRDGSLGFTYDATRFADIVGLDDVIVASTYDRTDETAGISVFDHKLNQLGHLTLGRAEGSFWKIKLGQGGDGRTFGVTWQDRDTNDLRFAVVEYK